MDEFGNGVEAIETIEDLIAHVQEVARCEETVGARSYTKDGGFKNASILEKSDPAVLIGMAGCLLVALSNQAEDGYEGAADGIALIEDFASKVQASSAKIRSDRERFAKFDEQIEALVSSAYAVGVIDTDPSDLSDLDRLVAVRTQLTNMNADSKNPELVKFLENQIAEYASSEDSTES